MKRIYVSILVCLMACSLIYASQVQAQSLNPIIFDGAHSGNPDVFFLPPMVSHPGDHPSFDIGKFDPTLSPSVQICLIENNACSSNQPDGFPLIFNSGEGADSVRVNVEEEHYITNWHVDKSDSESATYRISVLVDGVLLGFTDIFLFSTMKEAKNFDTGEIFSLTGGELPIKFRIEKDATDWRIAGPEGGILKFENGVVFDVPAGAVNQYVAIRLSEVSFSVVQKLLDERVYRSSEKYVLAGFSAEPNGLVFNIPVKATLSIPTPIGIPMQAEVDIDAQEYWISPTDLIYDLETGKAEITLTNFSIHIIVDISAIKHEVIVSDAEVPSYCAGKYNVVQDSNDWSSGNGCQVISHEIKITFPECQITYIDYLSETTPECGDDFKLTPVIVDPPPPLQVCRSQKLDATVIDQNGKVWEVPLRWISNDPSILDFYRATGVATGLKEGMVLIKAVTPDPRFSEETLIKVDPPPPIRIEPLDPKVNVGDTITLWTLDESVNAYRCDMLSPDGTNFWKQPVTWSLMDTSIADVDPQSGLVTGISPGDATITAMSGNANPASTTVEVVEVGNPPGCDLSWTFAYTKLEGWPEDFFGRFHEKSHALTLEPGWTLKFEVKAEDWLTDPPGNPIPQCLSDEWIWKSLDESIATVDQFGNVTANSPGFVSIRVEHAQYPEIFAYANVNVVPSWLDMNGNRPDSLGYGILDTEFFILDYSCAVGPKGDESVICFEEEDGYPSCPPTIVNPGQQFRCIIAINPYTDPNKDCVPPNVAHYGDTKCVGTVVERRSEKQSFGDYSGSYFEVPMTYRNEEAMQKWWLKW